MNTSGTGWCSPCCGPLWSEVPRFTGAAVSAVRTLAGTQDARSAFWGAIDRREEPGALPTLRVRIL